MIRLGGRRRSRLSEALAGAVRAAGFDLIRPSIPGGANGTTGFAPHLVTVETALSAGQAIKTLAHELAHVMLHDGTENRTGCRGRAEVEAESVAYLVCAAAGLHTDAEDTAGCRTRVEAEAESVAHIVCQAVRLATGGYSFGYVARWSGGDRRPSRRPPSES